MKQIIVLVCIVCCASLAGIGQHTLTIEIEELENNNGQVILEFTNENGEKITGWKQPIDNKKSTLVISNLKPGNYAFKYFHDENNNEVLDVRGIGIPKEGFGFSNNAKATFGPPSLKKTIFTVKGDLKVKCKPTYFKF